MSRWTRPSSVLMRSHVASQASSVNTTPDGRSTIASNSRSPASGPAPNPARSTPSGLFCAQRIAIGHSAAAAAAPCGSVGPSVRYSTTGATAAELRVARHRVREGGRELFAVSRSAAGPQRARSVAVEEAERLDESGVDLRLGQRTVGRVEHRPAEVEHVLREVEVEERRLELLVLRRRPAARSRDCRAVSVMKTSMHDDDVEGRASPRACAGCRRASAPGCRTRRSSPGSASGDR